MALSTRIRQATAHDAEAVVGLVHRFLEGSTYGAVFDFNPNALANLILLVTEHDKGVIFLGEREVEVGRWTPGAMIAGFTGPHPISGELYAEELAWWVDADLRGTTLGPKLLGSLEGWARQKGALMLKMVAPAGSSVGDFYLRRGYAPLETAYLKRL